MIYLENYVDLVGILNFSFNHSQTGYLLVIYRLLICVCMYSTAYYMTTLSDRNSYQTQKKESYDSLRLIEAKSNRRLMGSTDQADPNCFYSRIS